MARKFFKHYYKFMKCEHALSTIRDGRIKVSKLNELNDPFELHGVRLSDKRARNKFNRFAKKVNQSTRLICFSEDWRNPLLWSHYADNHRGVALELEVDDSLVKRIAYQKSRVKIEEELLQTGNNFDLDSLELRLLTTKYRDWAYESESRIILSSEETSTEGSLEFYELNDGVKIAGIVIGALCKLNDSALRAQLPENQSIFVTRSRLAFNSFRIVQDQRFKRTSLRAKM